MHLTRTVKIGVIAVYVAIYATACGGFVSNFFPSTPAIPTINGQRSVQNGFAQVGDCGNDSFDGTPKAVVDCAQPHLVEVFAIFPMPFLSYPSDTQITEFKDKCPRSIQTWSSSADRHDRSIHPQIYFPDQPAWNQGARSMVCYLTFDAPRAGSFGAGRWLK